MKTTVKFQRAILKSLAVVVSFVLISFTVSAQDFWRSLLKNEILGEMAMVRVDSKDATRTTNAKANNTGVNLFTTLLAVEADAELELEAWMVNENTFNATEHLEQATEEQLNIEEWMKNEANFEVVFNFETEDEKTLGIEEWMVNDSIFEDSNLKKNYNSTRVFIINDVEDSKLKLEAWMFENKNFSK